MKLFPHQQQSLEKTKDFNRCAYYLDMGLGKTYVGSEKVKQLGSDTILIVCQKSKIDDWVNHFMENYPEDFFVINITKKSGMDLFLNDKINWPKIGIINYELAFRRTDLRNLKHFTLMLDESSLIANEKAKRSKFILSLRPDNVVLLSGTPVSGKYEQLWSQCRLLGWNISKKDFYNKYIITKKIDVGIGFLQEIVVGYKNVNDLKLQLAEHGSIFMKTDEVINLPDQIHQEIFVDQDTKYKKFKKDRYLMLNDGTELVGDTSLTKILYERQLCGQYHQDKKMAFKDLLSSTNDRIIVFYNFTKEMEDLVSICTDLGRKVSIVRGGVKDLSAYENHDDSVTFVQYQAGAMGLNLQKANKIIYYTLPLGKGSSAALEQSKKRIHRIGQHNTCFYYYLLVKGSIEEWNLRLLNEGKELTDALFTINDNV